MIRIIGWGVTSHRSAFPLPMTWHPRFSALTQSWSWEHRQLRSVYELHEHSWDLGGGQCWNLKSHQHRHEHEHEHESMSRREEYGYEYEQEYEHHHEHDCFSTWNNKKQHRRNMT